MHLIIKKEKGTKTMSSNSIVENNSNNKSIYNRIKNMKMATREAVVFYILISPFIIGFFGLTVIPIINGIYLSMTNFAGFNMDTKVFVGLANYKRIWTDTDAIYGFFRSLMLGAIFIPISQLLTLFIASVLIKPLRGTGFFRAVFYLPSLIPVVTLGILAKGIFENNNGLINTILFNMGLNVVPWLGYELVMYVFLLMMVWKGIGGATLLIDIAALKGVPTELYEAATIDGANKTAQFFKITIPMISPVMLFNLILAIIGMLQMYGEAVVLSQAVAIFAVPLRPIYLFMVHVYQTIFIRQRFGYGLALLWVAVIIIIIMSQIVLQTSNKWVYYEVEQDEGKKSA